MAGFSGTTFDAKVVGAEPGEDGIPLIPLTHDTRPGGDHKFVLKHAVLRISVVNVRGKTVVVYLESVDARTQRSFPVFAHIANGPLVTMVFSRA